MNKKLKASKTWIGVYGPEVATFSVRCDEPMKRSKERTKSWKCHGNCKNCMCGIIKAVGYDNEHHGKEK